MRRDALIMLAMRVAGTLLWMAYTVVLARTLPKADFATVLYVINFAFTAVLVITLGRDVALLKIASQAWGEGRSGVIPALLARSRRIVLISGGGLIALLCGLWATGLNTPITREFDVALMTGLITSVAGLMALNRDCLRAVGRVWQSQLSLNFTRSVVPVTGSALVFYWGNMSLDWALGLFLASLVLSLIVEGWFLGRVNWASDPDGLDHDQKSLGRTGLELWPGDIANAVQMRMAGLIVGLLLSPEILALFLAAERIAGLAQFPIGAAAQAAAPRIARAVALGRNEMQAALLEAGKVMAAGALIGAGGAALIAWPALLLLGPGYSDALPITLVLTAAHLASMGFGLAQTALILTGHARRYSVISVMMASLGVVAVSVGTYYGGAAHGGMAAAVAYCATWWITHIIYTISLYQVAGLKSGVMQFLR